MPIFQIILREIHKIFCGVVKRNVQNTWPYFSSCRNNYYDWGPDDKNFRWWYKMEQFFE